MCSGCRDVLCTVQNFIRRSISTRYMHSLYKRKGQHGVVSQNVYILLTSTMCVVYYIKRKPNMGVVSQNVYTAHHTKVLCVGRVYCIKRKPSKEIL